MSQTPPSSSVRGRNPDSQTGLRSATNAERQRLAAAAATSPSPLVPGTLKKTPGKTTPKTAAAASAKPQVTLNGPKGRKGGESGSNILDDNVGREEEGGDRNDEWKVRIQTLEKNFQILREEDKARKAEIRDLRDKLEEEVWGKARLEEKVSDLTEKLKKAEDSLAEMGGGGGGGGGRDIERGDLDRIREERKREMKEVEDRLDARIKMVGGKNEVERGGGGGGNEMSNARKQRCVALTDSNGSQVSQDSIMTHIPREKRRELEVEVAVAYTLEEAYRRIDRGEINVEGAIVLIDDLTNDVRGTRYRPSVSPQQLLQLVDNLRRRVMAAGAQAVIVCQLKPMQTIDVTQYNDQLNNYLRREKEKGRDGFGCRTQIRLGHLKGDGYHVRPDFLSIIDKSYACAFLGIDVPDPTPMNEFAPDSVRRRWESDWPRLAGNGRRLTYNGR